MNNKTKKIKITNKESGEQRIYNSVLDATKEIDFKYITIMGWLSGRTSNKKYTAEYIDEQREF